MILQSKNEIETEYNLIYIQEVIVLSFRVQFFHVCKENTFFLCYAKFLGKVSRYQHLKKNGRLSISSFTLQISYKR